MTEQQRKNFHVRRVDETDFKVIRAFTVEEALREVFVDEYPEESYETLEAREEGEPLFSEFGCSLDFYVSATGKKVEEEPKEG